MAPNRRAFDTHQRLTLVQRFLEHLLRNGGGMRPFILDVGGYPGLLAAELEQTHRVITLDGKSGSVSDYIRGSGHALPFLSRSMEAVVVSDTLEHIAPLRRSLLIQEAARVSRAWILLGGPFRSPEVEQAESAVNEITARVQGRPNPWIEEHWENGLPDLAATRRELEGQGFTAAVVPNGSLFNWFFLKEMEMLFHGLPDAFAQYDRINDLYVRFWSDTDHRRPTYRHLIVAHRNPAQIAELMQAPPPKTGLEFFGPQTQVPPASPDAVQRIRAVAAQFERLIDSLKRDADKPGRASVDEKYLLRLEAILEEQEKRQSRLQARIDELEKRLTPYESSHFVGLWRRLRWR